MNSTEIKVETRLPSEVESYCQSLRQMLDHLEQSAIAKLGQHPDTAAVIAGQRALQVEQQPILEEMARAHSLFTEYVVVRKH